jgi:exosortase
MYLLLGVAFLCCYYPTFGWLYYKYELPESYYSHGYLIPFVTGYLIYANRKKLKSIVPSSDIIGLAVLIMALLVHVAGTMGSVNFLSGFSMFLYVFGFSLYLYGREMTKQIAFPLFFLIFMFPIPDPFINLAGLPSKSMATTLGLKMIEMMGIPYFREGFQIHLPKTMLVVGTPCNGMKSMISFLAIGSLFLYFTDIRRWVGMLIFMAIFPMAVFLNGCRVAILVYIAYHYGIEKASPESYLHTLSGMVVFVVGMIVLGFLIKIGGIKKRVPGPKGISDEKQ